MRTIVLIFLLIILAALIPVILIIGPQLDFSLVIPEPEDEAEPVEILDPDTVRYFGLKNRSCNTLAGDFYITTEDIARGSIHGLIPSTEAEEYAAITIADSFNYNQSTRTYVRGDSMKIVEGEKTTIWKHGRIYECNPVCVMSIMTEEDSENYYQKLYDLRTNCAYFGKTELPESVNLSKLLTFEKTGTENINGNLCDNFLIYPDKQYLQSINSTEPLFWALNHLEGPIQECLDESTGIIVFRNLTLDLTDDYLLEFEDDGYLKVNQQTMLKSFSTNVPESFLALPD